MVREGIELITELGSALSLLDFNFTGDSFKIINVFWPFLIFNRQQQRVKLILVGFLQEGDQKL
jgi:hypothetical protein